MPRRLVPPAILGGLDRWCAGQTTLLSQAHHWITARDFTDRRWQALAIRHSGVAGGAGLLVYIGGWPVGAAGAAWAVAAWRRAPATAPVRASDDEPEEPAAEPSPDERRAAYLTLIATLIGDRNGIHLGELYSVLRQFEHWAHYDDTQLRAIINDLGLPVRRTLRVGKIAGRSGIHGDDLMRVMVEQGIPYPGLNPSPRGVEPGHSDVEAPVEPVERGVEPSVESPSTAVTVITSSRDHEPTWPPQPERNTMDDWRKQARERIDAINADRARGIFREEERRYNEGAKHWEECSQCSGGNPCEVGKTYLDL